MLWLLAILMMKYFNRTDEDEAAGEAEYHRFWGWQKVVLTLILLSQLSAFVAICTGDNKVHVAICTLFPSIDFLFYNFNFYCQFVFKRTRKIIFLNLKCYFQCCLMEFSFFLQIEKIFVLLLEQIIGYAFYLHVGGTFCWLIAFVCAITTTYKFIKE
ncbi:unnamed protein product [Meloidogyne enterolobii]|uniref:Uncharacterized protein n=1 Tax=Meloidogyne enterolobii TaxID=390850 RepID=A0ACB0Y188_MELEN